MATSKLDLATQVNELGSKPKGDPLAQDEFQKFGNWTGQTDTKLMAQDLKKRGLLGADQLIDDNVDVNNPQSVRNAQSDWKVAAIQQILANAKKLNLRTPEEINANRKVLLTTPKWRDAINSPEFNQIHRNFWDVIIHSILPEQYAKFDKMEKSNLAKK